MIVGDLTVEKTSGPTLRVDLVQKITIIDGFSNIIVVILVVEDTSEPRLLVSGVYIFQQLMDSVP